MIYIEHRYSYETIVALDAYLIDYALQEIGALNDAV